MLVAVLFLSAALVGMVLMLRWLVMDNQKHVATIHVLKQECNAYASLADELKKDNEKLTQEMFDLSEAMTPPEPRPKIQLPRTTPEFEFVGINKYTDRQIKMMLHNMREYATRRKTWKRGDKDRPLIKDVFPAFGHNLRRGLRKSVTKDEYTAWKHQGKWPRLLTMSDEEAIRLLRSSE